MNPGRENSKLELLDNEDITAKLQDFSQIKISLYFY